MPILYDQHMHSNFSGDSEAVMEEEILSGMSRGLKGITFTEHNDIDFPYIIPGEEGMFDLDTEAYRRELMRLKEKYKGAFDLHFGVELGMQTDVASKNRAYAKAYDFDFIIYSCHVVNKKDPYYRSYWEGRSEEEALREYFGYILDNIKIYDDFDVLGHLDYPIRYAPECDKNYSYEKYRDLIDEILRTLIEKGKGLEVNTAGYRKYDLKDVHPRREILKSYKEMGGKIVTVGSDSHITGQEGEAFAMAEEALKSAGFDYYCVFENRQADFRKL